MDNLDLSGYVVQKMSQTVKNKTGQTILNEDGQPMTIMEAIATTIVQNAMKGDTSSILLARNLMKRSASKEEQKQTEEEFNKRIQQYSETIISDLKNDGLWYGEVMEIRLLAGVLCEVERIEHIMQMPDYEDMITEIRKDGSQSYYINPLHSRLDELRKQAKQYQQRVYEKEAERKRKGVMSKDLKF